MESIKMKNCLMEENQDLPKRQLSQSQNQLQDDEKSSSTSSDFLQKVQKYETKLQNKKIYQAPKLKISSDIYKRRMLKGTQNEKPSNLQYRYPAPNKISNYKETSPLNFVQKIESIKKITPEKEISRLKKALINLKDKLINIFMNEIFQWICVAICCIIIHYSFKYVSNKINKIQ